MQGLILIYLGDSMKILSLLLILFFGCKGNSNQMEQKSVKIEESKEMILESLNIDSSENVEGSIGIITVSESYEFGDSLKIYDASQKLLTTIIRTDENQIIALKCLDINESYYQVKLDNSDIGYIPLSSKKVMFQTWEEHILSLFSVGFDGKKNPLRKKPSLDAEMLYYDQDEFYHPNQIKGEWLQIKYGSEGNWRYGWIKWKSEDNLIIELYYFA